jgi:hypothetical protein
MTEPPSVSDRVLEQRVRNRVIEELSMLSDGATALQDWGWDYLLDFLDWFPNAPTLPPAANAMTEVERVRLSEVLRLVLQFSEAMPVGASIDQLLASGWVSRVAPAAKQALDTFRERGWFSEEIEEAEPSVQLR